MFETLIKKYGKLKLRKFLLELHPHLNKGQQKRNVKYIRATKFGATPEQMAENDAAHKGWDSNPNIVPQDLGDSLNTIDFESAFIEGKTGPSTRNFVNRSDIITWKNNVFKPHAFQIKYRKPGVSNLIQLLLTVLLAEYTDDPGIQGIKETRFMRYMNNARCFEMPGINIFGGFDEKTYRTVFDKNEISPDTDKQKMVKAELLMLLMRVFDMLHDFYDPGGRTGDIGKYMETFLKALVPVANRGEPGVPYYIVFYSFADQTYKNIQFPFYTGEEGNPLSMDFALQFPGAFIEFINQIQQNVETSTRGKKRYNEELTQTWSDHLFHFNMVTVARNKFKVKRILQHFLYETDRQHVVLNDVANHYTKLMDLYHNIHIAPSTFTDANSTGGSKPITVRDLVKPPDDGETIYYKLGGGVNTNRFIQGDARTKGAGMSSNLNLADLYDITARQIIPDFLSNADAWKTDKADRQQKSRVLTYNDLDKEGKAAIKLSVVSCYYDTIIHFEKNKPSMKPESYKMHLRFIDSNNETHIQAITGFETHIVTDSKLVTNEFLPIIDKMGWTVVEIIPNIKPRNLRQEFMDKKDAVGRADALEWLRDEHDIDINRKGEDGSILKTAGGKIKTLTDDDLKLIFAAAEGSGVLFEGAVFLCQTSDGRGRIFIVDTSLQFPGVDAIHKICRKIENNKDHPNTLKLNYYAQLTTIKFYGDSSQAQTPLRHLYTAGYSHEDMNKSVLLTQGDTTSTLVCALQNRLLPLVYDNFRKCNVLGGHPENAGYGGLFTLPALDYLPAVVLPPGWKTGIDPASNKEPLYYFWISVYDEPNKALEPKWHGPITDDDDDTEDVPYWEYNVETTKLDKVYGLHSKIPDYVKKHIEAGGGKFGSRTSMIERSPTYIQSASPPPPPPPRPLVIRLRSPPTEKINWKKPLTLDVSRLVKMPDGRVQFLRGIRATSLFKQLGITTEYGRNEIRQRIIKTPTRNTNFGKRQWYVNRSRNKKLYRTLRCGCNPEWVTPLYYTKITGKSFWKLPIRN
mgnify:CR=1 FL=1